MGHISIDRWLKPRYASPEMFTTIGSAGVTPGRGPLFYAAVQILTVSNTSQHLPSLRTEHSVSGVCTSTAGTYIVLPWLGFSCESCLPGFFDLAGWLGLSSQLVALPPDILRTAPHRIPRPLACLTPTEPRDGANSTLLSDAVQHSIINTTAVQHSSAVPGTVVLILIDHRLCKIYSICTLYQLQ